MSLISLNMVFWDDGKTDSTRIRNVLYTYPQLKKLTQYLKDNGVDAVCNLYDFSPEQKAEECIWIPFPLSEFRKSEKLNIVIKQQSEHSFFCMFDCDCFIDPLDYPRLLEQIKGLNAGDIVTYDLAKLGGDVNEYIIDGVFHKDNARWSYAYSGKMENGPLCGSMGGLGGVFICDSKILNEVGGYDEKYKTWGGEDGDLLDRIMISKNYKSINSTRDFAPYHLEHFTDWDNKKYKS